MAYVADVFDLEARKSVFHVPQAQKPTSLWREESTNLPLAFNEAHKTDADRGMFYDVHGLIFDRVAPNMRSMIEAALGLPPSGSLRSSSGANRSVGLKWLDILDVGCGCGTMGSQLKSLSNYIAGIDLSEAAIRQATRTGVYDVIKKGDAVAITKAMPPNSFDLVVAADVLPYFGDLGDLLRAMSAVTRSGGLVAFNADAFDVPEDGNNGGIHRAFELMFTGRWSHRRKYVTQSVAAAGMTVLGVRVIKGRTRLVSPAAGEVVLESVAQERRTIIFLCGNGFMTPP